MKITDIYIDMDGVLCAFHKRYEELYSSEGMEDYPAKSNNKVKEGYRANFKEFIETEQFATLEMLPDADFALIERFRESGTNVCILSSTAREEYWDPVSDQKFRWLAEHRIDYTPIFVPGKRYKKRYSGVGKVLIDDTFSVIEEWNAKGGIGIHHKSWEETISVLREHL